MVDPTCFNSSTATRKQISGRADNPANKQRTSPAQPGVSPLTWFFFLFFFLSSTSDFAHYYYTCSNQVTYRCMGQELMVRQDSSAVGPTRVTLKCVTTVWDVGPVHQVRWDTATRAACTRLALRHCHPLADSPTAIPFPSLISHQ